MTKSRVRLHPRYGRRWGLVVLTVTTVCLPGPLASQEVAAAEYARRRSRILEAVADGILLLHARPAAKTMEQWGFIQDPSFLYFSGLNDLPGAILALDGSASEVHLFVPPPPVSFGLPVPNLVPDPGLATARRYGLDSVRSWDDFGDWVESRLEGGADVLYVDEPRRPESAGVPPGLDRVSGHLALWKKALETRFPEAEIQSAKGAIQTMRWQKSADEMAILRRNAITTVSALLEMGRALRPGVTQREAEGVVVATCLSEGGEGPSFWPWTMAGANAHVERLVGAFFRYDQSNRAMEAGELVRVDIGCAGGLYGADVGRTLPVSGRFTAGQREAWDLLIVGYRAGLDAMGPGVEVRAVRAASQAAVVAAADGLTTDMGRRAAETIISGGEAIWHLHGVGIESGEGALPVLVEGAVIAYEPGFNVGPDAFYLEDMIAVTPDGVEVLSAGLPYRATEIEAVMAGR